MRRSSSFGPGRGDESFFERLKTTVVGLVDRLSGDSRRQAQPISRFRGQAGPVVPYHERREQLRRNRRRGHGSYAFIFVVVLLVLVVGLFYGLTWAIGGLSLGSGRQAATPTAVAKPVPPIVGLPAASPSPSPGPDSGGTAALPSPGVGTPGQPGAPQTSSRTYTVKPGDSPASIAAQFGITTDALMRYNGLSDPRSLQIGQQLKIPDR